MALGDYALIVVSASEYDWSIQITGQTTESLAFASVIGLSKYACPPSPPLPKNEYNSNTCYRKG